MNETIQCCLRIISPVHIGCDEVYEPMAFILNENNYRLVHFDPLDFLRQLDVPAKKIFTGICKKGTIESILEIYKFMREKRFQGDEVEVCPGFIEQYQKTLALSPRDSKKIQQELNNFTVSRTAFIPNSNRPYIPGSAIKGALRTAYLKTQATKKNEPTPRGKNAARDLEKALLDGGSFDTDPFRMLKITDFSLVGEVRTKIVYAVNRKKKLSKFNASGPYQILEVIEPGSLFEGRISVGEPEVGSGIKKPVTRDALLKSSEVFYIKEMIRENQELKLIEAEPINVERKEEAFPVRLGRHSGAECMTIEGHRNIRIMRGKGNEPTYDKHATTLWLAADSSKPDINKGLKPFGWVVIEQMSEDMIERVKLQEEEYLTLKKDTVNRRPKSDERGGREPAPAGKKSGSPLPQEKVASEIWDQATLTWNPGNQTVIAIVEGKKATLKGKESIPEMFHKILFEKRKSVTAKVEVEPVGGKNYRIITINPDP